MANPTLFLRRLCVGTDPVYLSHGDGGAGDGTWYADTVGTHPRLVHFSDMEALVGYDSAEVDTMAGRLANSFFMKTAAQVRADSTSILSNWQGLLNVVDTFSGYVEDAVGVYTGEASHVRGHRLLRKR